MTTTTPDTNTTTPSRPNYFILLGLDPNASWNEGDFKKALEEKRREWSRQSTSTAKRALQAQQNLALIPKIEALMADESEREQEAAMARSLQATERDERRQEFEKQLAFLNAKDALQQTELNKFIDDFQDIYTGQQIKMRVKVPVVEQDATSTSAARQLDPTIAKSIADHLQILKLPRLYEVLELSDATAIADLLTAAKKLYDNNIHRMPKTAEVTARVELAGLAMQVFKTEDMRRKYDESLRQASLDLLLKDLDNIMNRSTDKVLQSGQVSLFLENAHKAGWLEKEAYARLQEHALQRKWAMQSPTIENKLRCRHCQHLNNASQNNCSKCGRDLYVDCPNCGHRASSEDNVCGHCGFAVGNRYKVDDQLEELQKLFDKGDVRKVQQLLSEVEKLWPTRPDASDKRSQQLRKYRNELKSQTQKRRQAQEEIAEQLRNLITQKHFHEASDLLATKGDFILDRAAQQLSINQTLTRVQNLVKRVRDPGVNQDDKIDIVRQALSICADDKEVQEIQKTLTPSPPSNLQARVRGTVVSLIWTPSTTRNVIYQVVRKSSAQPNSVQDKESKLLDTVTGQAYEDTAPEVGVPLYYAVYAAYDTSTSRQAALLSEPILLTQEVSSLAAQVANQQVSLSWETPAHTHSVVVVRKEQAPSTSRRDGERVGQYTSKERSLTDRNLQNGLTYYYTLYCQFRNHEGRLVASAGQSISATPDTPPQTINHLAIKSAKADQGYTIQITWQRPLKGNGAVIRSGKSLSHVDRVMPETQLSLLGEKLEHLPDAVTDSWPKAGMAYYTPVVLYQGMAYLGTSQLCACVDNVTILRHQNIGTAIRFYWRWPENCHEVQLAYSSENWPSPGDPAGGCRRITWAEYDQAGYYDLRGTIDQDYYIAISAIVHQDGVSIPAEPIRIHTRLATKLEFTYEIRNPKFLRGKRILHITSRTPGTIPAMILISKQDRLPFKKSDGDQFQHLPAMLIKKELDVPLNERNFPHRTFAKLFLEDDTMHELVSIHHPSDDKLRLS